MDPVSHICPAIPLLAQITRLRFLRGHALLSSLDINPAQFHLLMMLDRANPMSQAELAGKLMIKPSTLTVMLHRLMKNDLVRRERDTVDARIMRVQITTKGADLLKQAHDRFLQFESETFEGFSPEEKALFENLGNRIRDNLMKAVEGEDPTCQWY